MHNNVKWGTFFFKHRLLVGNCFSAIMLMGHIKFISFSKRACRMAKWAGYKKGLSGSHPLFLEAKNPDHVKKTAATFLKLYSNNEID